MMKIINFLQLDMNELKYLVYANSNESPNQVGSLFILKSHSFQKLHSNNLNRPFIFYMLGNEALDFDVKKSKYLGMD